MSEQPEVMTEEAREVETGDTPHSPPWSLLASPADRLRDALASIVI